MSLYKIQNIINGTDRQIFVVPGWQDKRQHGRPLRITRTEQKA